MTADQIEILRKFHRCFKNDDEEESAIELENLLKNGMSVHMKFPLQDDHYTYPLILAVSHQRFKLAEILLQHQADPLLRDSQDVAAIIFGGQAFLKQIKPHINLPAKTQKWFMLFLEHAAHASNFSKQGACFGVASKGIRDILKKRYQHNQDYYKNIYLMVMFGLIKCKAFSTFPNLLTDRAQYQDFFESKSYISFQVVINKLWDIEDLKAPLDKLIKRLDKINYYQAQGSTRKFSTDKNTITVDNVLLESDADANNISYSEKYKHLTDLAGIYDVNGLCSLLEGIENHLGEGELPYACICHINGHAFTIGRNIETAKWIFIDIEDLDKPQSNSLELSEYLIRTYSRNEYLAMGMSLYCNVEHKPLLSEKASKLRSNMEVAQLDSGLASKSDSIGGTALIRAAEIGNLSLVRKLIKAGANINAVTNNHNTALSRAIFSNSDLVVDYLMRKKAKANLHDIKLALSRPAVLAVLIKYNVNLNITLENNRTPLEMAILNGLVKSVGLILAAYPAQDYRSLIKLAQHNPEMQKFLMGKRQMRIKQRNQLTPIPQALVTTEKSVELSKDPLENKENINPNTRA